MTIRIRQANILDVEALVAVQGATGSCSEHAPDDEHAWQKLIAEPGATTTWVATQDGVVGFIVVEAVGHGFPHLIRINELSVIDGSAHVRGALLDYALGDFGGFAQVPVEETDIWIDQGFTAAGDDGKTVTVIRS